MIFFAHIIRMENATPDVLEFARLFSSMTEDYVMCIGKLSLPFIYHTSSQSFYEKVQQEYIQIDLPKLPKRPSKALPPADIALLEDYRKAYLDSVERPKQH